MTIDFVTLLLGFVEGFALVTSPCILPILPIFLVGSLTGSKKKPLGIITGFSLFFALVVLFSGQLVHYLGIDFNIIRHFSYAFLFLLGVIMMSTGLTQRFSQMTQGVTGIGRFFSSTNKPEGGFLSGLILGALVAIVWIPCAGPILAAAIVQIITQKSSLLSFLTLMAFALGAAIPMLIIAFYGKKIINAFDFFKTHATLCRKMLGAILIASVVYLLYVEEKMVSPVLAQKGVRISHSLVKGLWNPYPAPAIEGIETWINSSPLSVKDLKGKVVLIDFWAYSCINCVRTLPYLKDWYARYHDKGLEIIGVHSPEFDFEKNVDHVKHAVDRYGIHYPVALDNQFLTWQNFNNHYWPALYLINKQGEVVYTHFGEGDDEVTENNIRFLLGIDDLEVPNASNTQVLSYLQTPETYLGYARANPELSPELVKDKTAQYHFSTKFPLSAWRLEGNWQVMSDYIVSTQSNAAIKIHFNARKVFAVMGNSSVSPITVKILLNGKPLPSKKDIVVDQYGLYEIVSQDSFGRGVLQMNVSAPGLKMYTFTFGN